MKKRNKYIGGIIIAGIILSISVISYFKSQPRTYEDEDIFVEVPQEKSLNDDVSAVLDKNDIVVEIKGEVKKPDVYKVSPGSIVKDLILEAGGLKDDADISKINQAMALKNGDCITIPQKQDSMQAGSSLSGGSIAENSARTPSGKLDVNRATKEELKTVPGIGDATADKIIKYREENGSIKSLSDLTNISRIGEATIKKFEDYLEVR